MKSYFRHLGAFAGLLVFSFTAKADLIFSQSFGGSGGSGPNPVTSVRATMEFTTDMSWGDVPVSPLFDRIFIPADIGKTFTADSSTPFFAHNIALATDGVNNRLGFSLLVNGGSQGTLLYEAEYFFGAPHNPFYTGKADLQGYSIRRVTLRVDQVTVPPSPIPYGGDYSFQGTVSFFDDARPQATPEPASVCLALLGALGVFAYRKGLPATFFAWYPG